MAVRGCLAGEAGTTSRRINVSDGLPAPTGSAVGERLSSTCRSALGWIDVTDLSGVAVASWPRDPGRSPGRAPTAPAVPHAEAAVSAWRSSRGGQRRAARTTPRRLPARHRAGEAGHENSSTHAAHLALPKPDGDHPRSACLRLRVGVGRFLNRCSATVPAPRFPIHERTAATRGLAGRKQASGRLPHPLGANHEVAALTSESSDAQLGSMVRHLLGTISA